jgi:hypothetical protein
MPCHLKLKDYALKFRELRTLVINTFIGGDIDLAVYSRIIRLADALQTLVIRCTMLFCHAEGTDHLTPWRIDDVRPRGYLFKSLFNPQAAALDGIPLLPSTKVDSIVLSKVSLNGSGRSMFGTIDSSSLQSLVVTKCNAVAELVGSLTTEFTERTLAGFREPQLRCLILRPRERLPDWIAFAEKLVNSFSRLELLLLDECRAARFDVNVIARHSSTLKHLALRFKVDWEAPNTRRTIDPEDLEKFFCQMQNLQQLALTFPGLGVSENTNERQYTFDKWLASNMTRSFISLR